MVTHTRSSALNPSKCTHSSEKLTHHVPSNPTLAGFILHHNLPVGAPEAMVKVNGHPFKALLDSGSAVTLVQTHVLPPRTDGKAQFPITCMHGDT